MSATLSVSIDGGVLLVVVAESKTPRSTDELCMAQLELHLGEKVTLQQNFYYHAGRLATVGPEGFTIVPETNAITGEPMGKPHVVAWQDLTTSTPRPRLFTR